MFKAQTGGTLRNIVGSMSLYAGMPSIEKSRAQAEGLNQVMANVRKEILDLIQDIQAKEGSLYEMQKMGTAKFRKDGSMIDEESSAIARKTFVDLEEQKKVLKSALAEVTMIDDIVSKSGGKISKIIKRIGFVMPELMANNTILQNINAGLDKNGKALKFQSRTAEILNYSFQLMSRHIGQIFKNWMMQLNPLTQIKKLFSDFASYNPKWQRTMNVVKYNLRDIILPMMEKIAQLLVNMIGFADIILQKIQAAFGKTPISLFDQDNANNVKKTYEDMMDISAGFDELHDIGSSVSENNPDNLLGEIYKPQLSEEWKKLAEDIGNLFAGIIKGDLGFGDVMKEILRLAMEGVKLIGSEIWKAIKNSTIGQYIQNHWLEILGWITSAFLAWSFLKWAGNKLLNALFGKLTSGAIGSIFAKVGGWITKTLGATSIGSGILQGISNTFLNGGGLVSTFKNAFTHSALITKMGGWGSMLGTIFVQSFGAILGGLGVAKGFDIVADDASYNLGAIAAGGDKDDMRSNAGGKILSTLTGAVAGGFVIGGPIGAAIGGLTGLLISSLAPAFEKVEVKSRDANNEMQKIEYYEGYANTAKTKVEELTELMDLSNEALKKQTDNVYKLGDEYGINRERLDTLIQAVEDGTYKTELLTDRELILKDSLDELSWKYNSNKDLAEKLTDAKYELIKAETDLAIMQDVEAENFELAAARIEIAEESGVMSTEEATKRRIQLYKQAGEEERKNLLQNLSPQQRELMANYTDATNKELAELARIWRNSSDEVRDALLDGVGDETRRQFESRMDDIDSVIKQHQGVWQGIGDTLKEIFTFGIAKTWTFNGEEKYYQEGYDKKKKVASMAVGTNYVPNDGLAYLHQGEAVIPKKYNNPYQPGTLSTEERAYMQQMISTMKSLDGTMKQGINVNGQFVQRGSDLVAVVNKTKSQTGADLLSNVAYAR